MNDTTQVASIADAAGSGSSESLLPLIYEELRRLAAHRLANERPGQTLQATALVHEAWLKLEGASNHRWNGSTHFFHAAAEAMRRILVDNARRKQRAKHGGELERVNADDIQLASPMPPDELLALDEALHRLAQEDPEVARLVELRFFAGMGHQEAAEIMGISRRAADGLWAYARSWLFDALRREQTKA